MSLRILRFDHSIGAAPASACRYFAARYRCFIRINDAFPFQGKPSVSQMPDGLNSRRCRVVCFFTFHACRLSGSDRSLKEENKQI